MSKSPFMIPSMVILSHWSCLKYYTLRYIHVKDKVIQTVFIFIHSFFGIYIFWLQLGVLRLTQGFFKTLTLRGQEGLSVAVKKGKHMLFAILLITNLSYFLLTN